MYMIKDVEDSEGREVNDDLEPHYEFDYSKAEPNKYASIPMQERKPDFKLLDEIDFVIAPGNPTPEESKQFSEFLKKRKAQALARSKRRAQPVAAVSRKRNALKK